MQVRRSPPQCTQQRSDVVLACLPPLLSCLPCVLCACLSCVLCACLLQGDSIHVRMSPNPVPTINNADQVRRHPLLSTAAA